MKIINDVLATKDDILIRDTILALRAPVVEEPENPTVNPDGTTPGDDTPVEDENPAGNQPDNGNESNLGEQQSHIGEN
jgi:hypothetical protein